MTRSTVNLTLDIDTGEHGIPDNITAASFADMARYAARDGLKLVGVSASVSAKVESAFIMRGAGAIPETAPDGGRIYRISEQLGVTKWGAYWYVGELATLRAGNAPEGYGGAFVSKALAVLRVQYLVEHEGFR